MPTEVLIRIGQTLVMKITKIAEGWPSRKAASESGSQASGGTVRSTWKIGIEAAHGERRLPEQDAEGDAGHGRERVAVGDAGEGGEDVPEEALVDALAGAERVGDDVPALVENARAGSAAPRSGSRRRAARPRAAGTTVTTGGPSCAPTSEAQRTTGHHGAPASRAWERRSQVARGPRRGGTRRRRRGACAGSAMASSSQATRLICRPAR